MSDTVPTAAVVEPVPVQPHTGAPKQHWYHAHIFHLGVGKFMSWLYTVSVLFGVPLMSSRPMSIEDGKSVLIAWCFLSFFYFWRKGKRITAHIDQKNVLTGRMARRELYILALPYAAVIINIGFWLWLRPSLEYSVIQWVILGGTAMVTTFVLDVNSAFITDLLKAAPIAERVEHDRP